MSEQPKRRFYLFALVCLSAIAAFSLNTLCLSRPTLVTAVSLAKAESMKLTDDQFILGPIMGQDAMVGERKKFTGDFFGFSYNGHTGELIDTHIYLFGAWAVHELEFMKMFTEVTNGKSTKFLDIGANVGTHSMCMSRYAAEVHAIEPWPPVLERLNAFVTENGVTNVTVHPVGYAAENGSLPFHEPDLENPGTGSFSGSRFPSQNKVVELPLVVGDEHLQEEDITGIDLIKIDIEGYEKPALQGLKNTIFRDRPTVLIELNVSNDEGIKSKEELSALFPSDYQFLELFKKNHRRVYPWIGDQVWLCQCNTKAYSLAEFDMQFDLNGTMVVAAPPEHAKRFY